MLLAVHTQITRLRSSNFFSSFLFHLVFLFFLLVMPTFWSDGFLSLFYPRLYTQLFVHTINLLRGADVSFLLPSQLGRIITPPLRQLCRDVSSHWICVSFLLTCWNQAVLFFFSQCLPWFICVLENRCACMCALPSFKSWFHLYVDLCRDNVLKLTSFTYSRPLSVGLWMSQALIVRSNSSLQAPGSG